MVEIAPAGTPRRQPLGATGCGEAQHCHQANALASDRRNERPLSHLNTDLPRTTSPRWHERHAHSDRDQSCQLPDFSGALA